jgi:glycerol uptake facilitator-like aquaporin
MQNKYLVEFLGTVLVVFVVLSSGHYLAIGLCIALTFWMGAAVSGAAYNPAVSLVMVYNNQLALPDLMPYIIAQLAGAMVALQLYRWTGKGVTL